MTSALKLADILIDACISTEKLRRVDPHFGHGGRFSSELLTGSVSSSPQLPQVVDAATI